MARSFELEPEGSHDSSPCECCGSITRRVGGFARADGNPFAAYFVGWTLGHAPEHGARFDLIVGRWGDGTTASDRCAVSLVYRVLECRPTFSVIDAGGRAIGQSHLADRALTRAEVVGQPIAHDIYALCDAILIQDARVAELLEDAGSVAAYR